MAAPAIDNEAELSIALDSEIRKVRNKIRDVSDELENSQLGLGISVQLGVQRRADAVVSVSVMLDHPYWAKRITRDGRLHDFLHPRRRPPRRQDLPAVYRLNGAIYLARPDVLLRRRTFYTPRTYAYVMPPERSIDIDDDLDLSIADHLLRRRGRGHD